MLWRIVAQVAVSVAITIAVGVIIIVILSSHHEVGKASTRAFGAISDVMRS